MSTVRGAMTEVKCKRCKQPFMARVADRKRGWGKFCSKSCKAVVQERNTNQFKAYQMRLQGHDTSNGFFVDRHGEYEGFSAHNFSNE